MNRSRTPDPKAKNLSSLASRFASPISHLSFLILLIPAIQPLLTANFTCGYDNTFHLWRAVEMELLLRQGALFSRWAPNMAHGYGYPLFNFAAPASVYGATLLRLLNLPWPWALNLAFIAGWILSAYTMYLFVSDLYTPNPQIRVLNNAGLIAALLYTYAPFHAYDVLYRGGLSQSSAWLFPPLVLWALRRADNRAGFAVTVLGFSGLILTHNAFALLFAPLLLAYTLVVGRQRGERAALWGGLALAVGLGLSAFFWLPALVELGFVHSERLNGAWVFQYTNNFLPVEQLFAPPRTADPTLINDWPARGLGLIPTLLAVTGLVTNLRNRQQRLLVAFFAGALALYLFLTLPISRPVWDALPLLQQVQFPWRLVGPAALCAAVLAGSILANQQTSLRQPKVTWRPQVASNQQILIVAVLILLLILSNLGWFYPRHCPSPQDITIGGMIAWEQATDTLGTTAKGEYLPTWVHRMPEALPINSADDGTLVARLPSESLPEGTHIVRADYNPVDATIEIETPVPFQARYLAFYYPGWCVTVDDEPVRITPTEPNGLISFDVPAGRHAIHVHLGETGLRLAADALSLLSLAALTTILIFRLRPPKPKAENWSSVIGHWSLALATALLIAKVTVLDRIDTPLHRPNLVAGHLRDVDISTEITFGDEFVLLGHDALPESVHSDERFELDTYWRALQPGGSNYGVTVNVVDTQDENRGYRWSGPDIRPPRWHRTPPPVWEWPPEQYASVAFSVPLLPGTPPGTYTVEIVAFDHGTLIPLTAHDTAGRALGPALPLGQITVTAPRRPSALDTLDIRRRLDAPLGPLTLVGADFDRGHAAPGDPILLTTFWHVEQQPPKAPDLSVHLTLLAPDGSPAAEFDLPPTITQHPTSDWKPDQVWRGQHLLHLPAGLDDGDYTWHLTLHPTSSATHLPSSLTITAPDRTFTPPPMDVNTNTRLGNVATLLGAALEPATCKPANLQTCRLADLQPGIPLTVTLIWRTETEAHTSYNVFLHLIGPDGALAAQSDSIPANWTRPTTGWIPGEIISDVHTLALPADVPTGDYTLVAGLYVPGDGRLTAPDGADAIPLTTIMVETE